MGFFFIIANCIIYALQGQFEGHGEQLHQFEHGAQTQGQLFCGGNGVVVSTGGEVWHPLLHPQGGHIHQIWQGIHGIQGLHPCGGLLSLIISQN